MSVSEDVWSVLVEVLETDEVHDDPDLRLYDVGLLDSLRTVELIVALSERLGVSVSPADVDREHWATPRGIVEDVERRLREGAR